LPLRVFPLVLGPREFGRRIPSLIFYYLSALF
jgi:hypothetical protein